MSSIGNDAGNNAFVPVASGHLVAYLDLPELAMVIWIDWMTPEGSLSPFFRRTP